MVNLAELVGGAALGTALSLLVTGFEDLIRKNYVFPSHLKDIHSRLQQLQPVFNKMAETNPKLTYTKADELKGLEKVLKKGNDLVDRCKKVSRWNIINRYRYAFKLIAWDEEFEKQLKGVVLQGIRDGKMTGVKLEAVVATTDKIKVSTGKIEVATQKLDFDQIDG